MQTWSSDYFGRHRICFGGLCHAFDLTNLPVERMLRVDCEHHHLHCDAIGLRADPNQMPFQTGSVDLLVLPLTLELCTSPERVVREAERVVADDGRIVIYGINPWSIWSLMRRISGGSDDLPRRRQQLSRRRIREWLRLLDFDIERQTSLLYSMPRDVIQEKRKIDHWGGQLLPGCGILYGIQAIKRIAPLSVTKVAMKRFRIANTPEPVGSLHAGVMKTNRD